MVLSFNVHHSLTLLKFTVASINYVNNAKGQEKYTFPYKMDLTRGFEKNYDK